MATIPYSRILVSGDDAFDFLQAQLTNDLRLLDAQEQLLAAWCNPKGRVICILRVSRAKTAYQLLLPAELAESVLGRLAMFRAAHAKRAQILRGKMPQSLPKPPKRSPSHSFAAAPTCAWTARSSRPVRSTWPTTPSSSGTAMTA